MGKIWDIIKNIPQHYADKKIREAKMDEFLNGSRDNCLKITEINTNMVYLKEGIDQISRKVNTLESQVGHINDCLDIISSGTKMELFDTLLTWKKILCERGWASEAEKREVQEIYEVYHDGLHGNGQGEIYYNQIMNLPEEKK